MANAYFPTLLREFSETYPQIKLVLKTSDYFDNVYEKLKQNEIDFALFIDRKMVYKDCNTVVDHPEEMIFIASPDNPLASRKDIPIQDIVSNGFITSDQEVSYPRFLDDYCKDNGFIYSWQQLGVQEDMATAVTKLADFAASDKETFKLAVPGVTPEQVQAAVYQVEAQAK